MVDEALKSLAFVEEVSFVKDMMVIILYRDSIHEASGIILTGGADFKEKNITVRKLKPSENIKKKSVFFNVYYIELLSFCDLFLD